MKPRSAVLVLSCVIVLMFSFAWAQNSNVPSNSNAVRNATNRLSNARRGANLNRNGGGLSAGVPCPPNATSNIDCDPNANWNDKLHSNNNDWNAVNVVTNSRGGPANMQNANEPRKALPKKRTRRRPTASLGGAFTLQNSMSAMLAAGVS